MVDDKKGMRVTTLLKEYQKRVNEEAIQFLPEKSQQKEISKYIRKLHQIMKENEREKEKKTRIYTPIKLPFFYLIIHLLVLAFLYCFAPIRTMWIEAQPEK